LPPPDAYRRIETAYRRGHYAIVLAEGDAAAATITADDDHEPLTGPLAIMMGVAHAAYESLEAAVAYLTFGVDRIRADEPEPIATADPPAFVRPSATASPGPYPVGYAPGAMPGTIPYRAAPARPPIPRRDRERFAFADHGELLLVEISLSRGEVHAARARLPRLVEPHRAVTTRFAATRAQSAIAAQIGEMETAHHFANTAAGLATRIPSRMRAALVDADRAVLLARQGRGYEAINIADRVLGRLVRPLVGPDERWARTEAAIVALTLSRHAAIGGDQLSAERLLHVGAEAGEGLDRRLLDGQIQLATATLAIEQGRHDEAEAGLLGAVTTFHRYGYRPSAARAMAEQARLAHLRDLYTSARPLYESALAELRAVELVPEARDVQRMLRALEEGSPPPPSPTLQAPAFVPGSGTPNRLPPSSVPPL